MAGPSISPPPPTKFSKVSGVTVVRPPLQYVMASGKSVYLDYNATTPLAPEVLDVITETLRDAWANPSSSNHLGQKARQCIVKARNSVAKMINAKSEDIVFTSGGTESNNMVIHSAVKHFQQTSGEKAGKPHIIINNLEHNSVTLTVRNLEEQGKIEVTEVKATPSTGAVSPADIVAALRPTTILISLMLANNETGVIQPVGEVVRVVRGEEVRHEGGRQRIFVHTDAAQALGKIRVDIQALGVDYLSVAGHKFYGPRAGALYVRGLEEKATPLFPILFGGGQERGFRPGTENTGMIAGLGKAAELVADHVEQYSTHMRDVRDYLEQQLTAQFGGGVHFNGRLEGSERIPNTCNVSIVGEGLQSSRLLSSLEHCQASQGAACHSYTISRPSPILLAIGIPAEVAANALRVSVGRDTTREDIDVFVQDLKNAIGKLQS